MGSDLASSPLVRGALELACEAHEGARSRADTGIEHPRSVARLLAAQGFDEEVVAAGLLHDVVEDSTTDIDEIKRRFGAEVSDLVAAMTEDEAIPEYGERKSEHRDRVVQDRRVAAIYAADKLARLRDAAFSDRVPGHKLDHYRETLRVLRDEHPGLPFLKELHEELLARAARSAVR